MFNNIYFCPICGANKIGRVICPTCEYDESKDYEMYPTINQIPKGMNSGFFMKNKYDCALILEELEEVVLPILNDYGEEIKRLKKEVAYTKDLSDIRNRMDLVEKKVEMLTVLKTDEKKKNNEKEYSELEGDCKGRFIDYDADVKTSSEHGFVDIMDDLSFFQFKKKDTETVEYLESFLQSNPSNGYLQWKLGLMYLEGDGCNVSYDRARSWIEKAAKNRYSEAFTTLGYMYDFGEGVPIDKGKAIELYEIGSKLGSTKSKYNLAWCYRERGEHDKAKNLSKEAVNECLENRRKSERIEYTLYQAYYTGFGIEKNEKEAVQWLEKATINGNIHALVDLAEYYYRREEKRDTAYSYFRIIEKCDNADALYNLAKVYKRLNMSKYLYANTLHKAAEKKCRYAQYYLSICFFEGIGIGKNEKEGIGYLIKSADSGFVEAQYSLSLRYFTGNGVDMNWQLGKKYLKLAATQGNQDAISLIKELEQNGVKWF